MRRWILIGKREVDKRWFVFGGVYLSYDAARVDANELDLFKYGLTSVEVLECVA